MKHAQKVRELLLFLLLMLLLLLLMMMVIMIMMTLFCYYCCRLSLLIMTFAAALLLLLLLAAADDRGMCLPFAGVFPRPRQLGVDGGRCLPRHACGRREPTSPQGGQRRVHDAQAGRQRGQGAAAHGRAGGARAGAGRARCRLVGVDRGAQQQLEARRRQSRVEAPGGVHQGSSIRRHWCVLFFRAIDMPIGAAACHTFFLCYVFLCFFFIVVCVC